MDWQTDLPLSRALRAPQSNHRKGVGISIRSKPMGACGGPPRVSALHQDGCRPHPPESRRRTGIAPSGYNLRQLHKVCSVVCFDITQMLIKVSNPSAQIHVIVHLTDPRSRPHPHPPRPVGHTGHNCPPRHTGHNCPPRSHWLY